MNNTTMKEYIELEECGCCGAYHRPEFYGDCRDDSERFPTWQVYEGKYMGKPALIIDDGDLIEGELFRYL